MSGAIEDGGLAFPVNEVSWGMSLRDYFAAKALPSFVMLGWKHADAAERAYLSADAMIQARKAVTP